MTTENVFAIMTHLKGNEGGHKNLLGKDLTMDECRSILESEGYHETTHDNRKYEKTTEDGRNYIAVIMRVRF